MRKITPFLWFDRRAEEAVELYTSLFPDSTIDLVTHYSDTNAGYAGLEPGSVQTISFRLKGEEFIALNGGPMFQFTPAMSLLINCESQEEIDTLWEALGSGGNEMECGWLTDRFGLTWQIVPAVLWEMLNDPDPAVGKRVMDTYLTMVKIDIATLERARAGG